MRIDVLEKSVERLRQVLALAGDGGQADAEIQSLLGLLLARAGECLTGGDPDAALRLTILGKSLRRPARGLDFARGLAFLGLGRPMCAVQALKEELRHFPDNEAASSLLERIGSGIPGDAGGAEEADVILEVARRYTMVGPLRLRSLYDLALEACQADLPGNFVECGVAAGGTSALLAGVLRRHSRRERRLYSFDSFSGMPAPTEFDRHEGQEAEATGWGSGTCAAPEDSLLEACGKVGARDLVVPVKGFFKDTLPVWGDTVAPIALLHMDGDWYESSRDILVNLYDRIVPGGLIQIDDYGYWEGCRKAVHEFEAARGLSFTLHVIDDTGVWLRKP